jgi:hypothetical protein
MRIPFASSNGSGSAGVPPAVPGVPPGTSTTAGRAVLCPLSGVGREIEVLPPSHGGQGTGRPTFPAATVSQTFSPQRCRERREIIPKEESGFTTWQRIVDRMNGDGHGFREGNSHLHSGEAIFSALSAPQRGENRSCPQITQINADKTTRNPLSASICVICGPMPFFPSEALTHGKDLTTDCTDCTDWRSGFLSVPSVKSAVRPFS